MILTNKISVRKKIVKEGKNCRSLDFQCDLKSPYLVKMMTESNNNNNTKSCYCIGSEEYKGKLYSKNMRQFEFSILL